MKKRRIIIFYLLILLTVIQPQKASAHSGGTDANGGHWNRKTGTYHYHNGGSSSSSNSNSSSNSSSYTISKAVYPSSVKMTRPSGKIYVGRSIKFTATVFPSNADNKSVKWSSSNETVAKISSDGTLTPVFAGTITISATTSNGMIDELEITVLPVEAELISLVNPLEEIEIGKKEKLSYEIVPSDTTNKRVNWESSNPEIISVNNYGDIEALSLGEAMITIITENNLQAECIISVFETEVSEILLDISAIEWNVNDIINIDVVLSPENSTYKDYILSYSNPDVIETISDNSVKLLSPGELVITAMSQNGKTTSATINVILPVYDIIIEPDSITMFEGERRTLIYDISPIDATIQSIRWSCLNDEIVSVDEYGNILAAKRGKTIVTAIAYNGVEKSVSVIVKPYYEKLFRNYGGYVIGGVLIIVIIGVCIVSIKKLKI